jgi:iron-sulfur cluster repair di-iron protein
MTTEIDLLETPTDEYRDQLFDALGDAERGDELAVVAERDVDPHLIRYQIERDRSLDWVYAHPDAEPRELAVTVGDPLDVDGLGSIDVRDLKPQRRHEALLAIFDELGAEEGFVLVNDHDPKPLYHELTAMHGDVIDWAYESRESGQWRVEIRKTEESDAADEDVVTRYDVRDIPKAERHPTIHHRYGMIPEGGTLELLAPHEPEHLREEFRQQYDSFDWAIVESEPGFARVRITKGEDSVGDEASDRDSIEVVEEFDVRELPPARRHQRIYDAYDDLDVGTGFVLVNDHDPKPLYHQFDAEAGPEFRWEYRQRAQGEFRVLIGKVEVMVDDLAAEATAASDGAVPESSIDPEASVGSLVREHLAFAKAFESLGIDLCCGGDRSLQAACTENDLELDVVRERLVEALEDRSADGGEWETMPELVDHVVETHHEHLRDELPALADIVETVNSVHGDAHPELAAVEREFHALADAIRAHIAEEEEDVFPVIESLARGDDLTEEERAVLDRALADLEADHEETADHLERIADLTDDYAVPDDACPSYRSMLDRLEALEADTHLHVHKENNVLFEAVETRLADPA